VTTINICNFHHANDTCHCGGAYITNLAGFECVQHVVLDNKPQSLPRTMLPLTQISTHVSVVSACTHLRQTTTNDNISRNSNSQSSRSKNSNRTVVRYKHLATDHFKNDISIFRPITLLSQLNMLDLI